MMVDVQQQVTQILRRDFIAWQQFNPSNWRATGFQSKRSRAIISRGRLPSWNRRRERSPRRHIVQ